MASHGPAAPAQAQNPAQPESRGLSLNLNRSNISVWMVASVAVLLIGMAVALFDLWFQSFYYASTDNAFVEGNYMQIGTPGSSQVVTIDVRPGEMVEQGQMVATLKLLGGSTAVSGGVSHSVKAPRAGVVVSVPAREGQLLTTGQAVVVLTDPDALWVVANVDENALRGVRVGQPAELQITVLERSCQGIVTEVLPQYSASSDTAQARSRTTSTVVPVRVDFAGDCPGVHPGMSAYAQIKIR